jgi:hypothetical protein
MTANGKPVRFTLNGGNLQLDTNGRTVNGQAKLDLAQTGQLQATLQAQDPLGAAQLSGKIDATITDLKVVSCIRAANSSRFGTTERRMSMPRHCSQAGVAGRNSLGECRGVDSRSRDQAPESATDRHQQWTGTVAIIRFGSFRLRPIATLRSNSIL